MKVHFAHKSLRRFALLSMFLILFGTLAAMASNLNGDLNSFFNLAYSSILSPFGAKAGNPAPVLSSPSAVLTATIATDKEDYAPGETVLITGTGFSPGETVRLQIIHITPPGNASKGEPQTSSALLADHEGHDPWDVVADSN